MNEWRDRDCLLARAFKAAEGTERERERERKKEG
jgi:hypothetical protein